MQNNNRIEQRKWLLLQDGPCGDCISNAHVKPILQQYLLTNTKKKQMLFVLITLYNDFYHVSWHLDTLQFVNADFGFRHFFVLNLAHRGHASWCKKSALWRYSFGKLAETSAIWSLFLQNHIIRLQIASIMYKKKFKVCLITVFI